MTAKADALAALEEARKMMDSNVLWTGLKQHMLRVTLTYAIDLVEAIQEVKRRRKEKQA